MATIDDLIEEIFAEIPDPIREGQQFINLDDQVFPPLQPPADKSWIEILNNAKIEFEVDGAASVFSTWRVEGKDPIDIGSIEIPDGIHARAGQLALDALGVGRCYMTGCGRRLTTMRRSKSTLKAFKRGIGSQTNKVQCQDM